MVDIKAYKQLKESKRLNPKEYKNYIINRTMLICIVILALIHVLDVISTVIGLSLGAVETNPITGYLFTLGYIGYIFGSIYVLSIFVWCFMIIHLSIILYKKITYQDASISLICGVYIGFTILVGLGILMVILNNINVIIYYLI